MRVGPSQEEIRRQNLGALLRHVHLHGATSRAELTTALGLNRSTIGALTADLAGAGLVSEGAPRETGRAGRPSPVVRPESARVYGYAASVEVDRIRAARIGLGGIVLDRREVPRAADPTIAANVPLLAGLISQMQPAVPVDAVYVGAGVSLCGPLRRADPGLGPATRQGPTQAGATLGPAPGAAFATAPGAAFATAPGAAFATALGAALAGQLGAAPGARIGAQRPVLVGHPADVCALAEHVRGAAVNCADVIYLHRDVEVDAGIIIGGRPLTGVGGHGGAVGHMVVRPGGQPCRCGSHGCWETEIGEYDLEAARRGDAHAQAAVRQVGDWLGFGVANLVNIFNPGMVIFGGTLRDVYLAAAARVRSRLNSMVLSPAREQVRLRTPALGEDAALIGAAELAFERLLADPLDAGCREGDLSLP